MSELSKKLDEVIALFKGKTKTPVKTNADVTGTDGTRIEYEGDELAVGMTVTVYQTVDGTEAVVESFTGDVSLEDGTVVTITENVVEAIVEAEPAEDVEALKSENQALKAELEELKASSTVALKTIESYIKGIGKKLDLSGGAQKFVKNTPEKEENRISNFKSKMK